jgi:hypothetical protein
MAKATQASLDKWTKKVDELSDNAKRSVALEIWQVLHDQNLPTAKALLKEAAGKPYNKHYVSLYNEALKDIKKVKPSLTSLRLSRRQGRNHEH